MKLPFLSLPQKNSTYRELIQFWSRFQQLSENDKNLYTDRIYKEKFTANDIDKLFEWKNGMKLNGNATKQPTVDKIKDRLIKVNRLKRDFHMEYFKSNFSDIGAIWQIFLLHTIQPANFPIFDQHVYRAHIYLTEKVVREIPNNNAYKLKYYFEQYLPFFETIKFEVDEIREIDLALLALGKFLKSNYAKLVL